MNNPECYITASLDRHVKIWSREGDLFGDIITYGENPVITWKFPYDWSEQQEKEKNEVISIMKKLEPNEKYDKMKIEYDNIKGNRKIRLTKKNEWDQIVPKRTFAKRASADLIVQSKNTFKEREITKSDKIRIGVIFYKQNRKEKK